MPLSVRFRSAAALLTTLCLALLPPSVAAIVVHGLEHVAAGQATLTDEPDAATGGRKLVVSNIGSSGQDGVDITLHQSRASVFDLTPVSGATDGEDFAVYRFPSDATPIIRGSALGGNGTQRVLTFEVPTPEMTVELWLAGQMVVSQQVPGSTPVVVTDFVVAADTGRTIKYEAKAGSSGSAKREISLDQTLPPDCVATLLGIATPCDRVVVSTEVDPPLAAAASLIRLRTRIALGGPTAAIAITQAGISTGAQPRSPRSLSQPSIARMLSGGLHAPDDTEGALSYTTAGGPTPTVISLAGAETGSPGGGVVARVRLRFEPTFPPETYVVADVADDDGSGAPPSSAQVTLHRSLVGDGEQWSCSSSDPADEGYLQLSASGVALTPSLALGTLPQVHASARAIALEVVGDPGDVRGVLAYPPGTTFTVAGQPYVGDQIVMSSGKGGGRSIRDIRIVHPPGTPPGTWRLTQVTGAPTKQYTDASGRPTGARGPRQGVSLDGAWVSSTGTLERRLPVRNLGSSGEDGVEVHLRGAPSVSFDLLEDPADSPPEGYRVRTHGCTDGSCAPLTGADIEVQGPGLRVRSALHGATVQMPFTQCRVGDRMLPYSSVDLDGDGWIDLAPATPEASRIQAVRAMADVSDKLAIRLDFSRSASVTCDDGVHVVDALELWTTAGSGGGGGGGAGGSMQVASLSAVPSSSTGVCDFGIRPPGLLVSGAATARADIGVLRAGLMTRSTWGRFEGEVEVSGDEGGDAMRVLLPRLRIGAAAMARATSDVGSECTGFLAEIGEPAGLIWSPRSNLVLRTYGDLATGETGVLLHDIWWAVKRDSGRLSIGTVTSGGGAGRPQPRISVYSGPTLVAQEFGDSVMCDAAPTSVFSGGDLDGDGAPEVTLRLPPGTPVIVGGGAVVGDRVQFEPLDLGTVTAVHSAELDLAELPPGVPVTGLRLSQVVPSLPNVSAPPRGPATRTLELRAVAPNPARGDSHVRFALGTGARVRAEVLDVAGRVIATLADGERVAGEHTLTWDGRSSGGLRAAPGLYVVRLAAKGLPTRTARILRLE